MVQIKFQQMEIPPGQNIFFHDISWEDFETILDELGEHRGTRIAYNQGILKIMAPLPEHEVDKVLIGDMLKIILDELGMDWECFGSTTFKHQEKSQGIEPDDSFYIKNHLQMRGKKRINLTFDPPPDLAIEIDLTLKTQISTYEALAVPELWIYEKNKLKIYILQDEKYIESATSPTLSPTFPNFAMPLATIFVPLCGSRRVGIVQIIPEYIQLSKIEGTSPTLRAFRKWVREQIG